MEDSGFCIISIVGEHATLRQHAVSVWKASCGSLVIREGNVDLSPRPQPLNPVSHGLQAFIDIQHVLLLYHPCSSAVSYPCPHASFCAGHDVRTWPSGPTSLVPRCHYRSSHSNSIRIWQPMEKCCFPNTRPSS